MVWKGTNLLSSGLASLDGLHSLLAVWGYLGPQWMQGLGTDPGCPQHCRGLQPRLWLAALIETYCDDPEWFWRKMQLPSSYTWAVFPRAMGLDFPGAGRKNFPAAHCWKQLG